MASEMVERRGSFATPKDPLVLANASAATMLIGEIAARIPARRALRIDPARLLREG
jgi:ABC-type antimicrobial peptide transport system permease subunit